MQVVVGRFYNKIEDAIKNADKMTKIWKGRCRFYAIEAPNGNLVISESQARKCFPDLKLSFKNRRYDKLPSKLMK